jgi:SAM-dependent methyltransferase
MTTSISPPAGQLNTAVMTGPARSADGSVALSNCAICGDGELEVAFTLPVYDGPYTNENEVTFRSFSRCEACGFLSVQPFDSEHYRAYYTNLNGPYHSDHDADTSRYERIAAGLPLTEIRRLLDWGCGTGTFLSMLPPTIARCGIELSAAARKLVQEQGIQLLSEDDITGEFSNSFDAVTAIDVAEHVKDLLSWRQQIAAALRPDGHFIFMTGNLDSSAAHRLGRRWNYLHYAEHVSFFTETAARKWLEPDFEDICIEPATHHAISGTEFAKCAARYLAALITQKAGIGSTLRIPACLPSTSDHMIVRARRRT